MKHFVVTGCARSGTGYTAELLTRLGAECPHEAVFSPYTERFDGWGAAPGESSWLAVPMLDQLPEGTVVLHQVRHPAKVVASLLDIKFFSLEGTASGRDWRSRLQVARARGWKTIVSRLATKDGRSRAGRRRSDFVAFVRRTCPEIFDEADETARAARYWVEWNRAAARADDRPGITYLRYRLEDLDATLTARLLDAIGAPADAGAIDAAIAALPRSTNTRRTGGSSEAPLDLTANPDVAKLALEYGYDLGSA